MSYIAALGAHRDKIDDQEVLAICLIKHWTIFARCLTERLHAQIPMCPKHVVRTTRQRLSQNKELTDPKSLIILAAIIFDDEYLLATIKSLKSKF